ncbi:MAG: sugar-binding protein, partial [Methanococcaceae archaeon]
MKKSLLVLFSVLLLSGMASAQVIANFETGTDGFGKGWGSILLGVQQIADPTGKSGGVLELNLGVRKAEADGFKGAVTKNNVDAANTSTITYNVWLPAGTPDSLVFAVWAGDKDWSWAENKYYAKDIPKEVWFPVYFDAEAAQVKNSGWSLSKGPLASMGIEFKANELKGNDTTWTGKVYVDNVRLVGVKPIMFGTFETGTDGFGKGWGSVLLGVQQIADPTGKSGGVLELNLGTRKAEADGFKGAVSKGALDATDAAFITYNIWLPAGTPDSLVFAVWAGDKSWSWAENKYYAKDIPKEAWYPVRMNMEAAAVKDANWSLSEGSLAALGIEFKADELKGNDTTWTGKVYIDNARLLGTKVGEKWMVCDFQSTLGATQGFSKMFGNALVTLDRIDVNGNGVLRAGLDFSKEAKGAFSKGSVRIYSDTLKKTATELDLSVFLPADIPVGGQIGLIVNGAEGGWNETPYAIAAEAGPKNIIPGKWNQMKVDITALVAAGSILDPIKPVTVGIQIFHGGTTTYKGDVYFDSLIVVGIPEPFAVTLSPKSTAAVKAIKLAGGGSYESVSFAWEDNKLGTEVYNIYASDKPITDTKAEGVKKLFGSIPHGMMKYGYRPWSTDGASKTFYFAITAFDGLKETALIPECTVGPIEVKTSPTFKVKYVKDFATKFVLDGMDDEFADQKQYLLVPEDGNYVDTTQKWSPENTDMNFKATLVIDDKYLYISADVSDDDLRTDPAQQGWEGDALEFYMGFYDASVLSEPHAKNFQTTNGDWRFGFNALGETVKDGGASTTINGIESAVYPKFSSDGYIIEARIALDSMAANGHFQLKNGMMMPVRIDANDWDPTKGDVARSLVAQVGGSPDTDEGWKRPDAWGFLEVVG